MTDRKTEEQMREARRDFMKSCGKFAVVTPAAMTLLLSASRQNYATAGSHNGFRRQGNNGFGNGGGDGIPGNSGSTGHFTDVDR